MKKIKLKEAELVNLIEKLVKEKYLKMYFYQKCSYKSSFNLKNHQWL